MKKHEMGSGRITVWNPATSVRESASANRMAPDCFRHGGGGQSKEAADDLRPLFRRECRVRGAPLRLDKVGRLSCWPISITPTLERQRDFVC